MTHFIDIAKDAFKFLETDYGFTIHDYASERYTEEVRYLHLANCVGVRISYEPMERFVFVFIHKLVNGEIRNNPLPITPDSVITCFEFSDALPDNEKMMPSYMYDEACSYFDKRNGLRYFVKDFASRLQKYGKKVLSGDFSILPRMEILIKERAQVYRER